ncbi:MAG: HTH domain-containing protein [Christensenellaceae bacterium]|jgi:transposase
MNRIKPLSQEQIEYLRKSPHVCSVSEVLLSFTAEFKKFFYTELQKGKTPKTILKEVGIDPKWMGDRRIHSLRTVVMGQAKRTGGFTDNVRRIPMSPEQKTAQSTEEKIARLEHELAYTKQELEYLKKIYLADREAEQVWLLKHRRKLNSESFEK